MKRGKYGRKVKPFDRKLRRLAAVMAGAAILSTVVPGLAGATARAEAAPLAGTDGKAPIAVTQRVGERDTGQKAVRLAAKQNVAKKSQAPARFEKKLEITATAYAPGPHDNDQWGNKTYTGEQIRPGIIAVDPRIIPLGSRVYIEYPDGHGEYAVASDTGGAIKGNRIDVAKWTVAEAEEFGIQHVNVYVVSTPAKA